MAYLLAVIWLVTVCGYCTLRIWRHGVLNPSGYIPPWWPYGEDGWLAYNRSMPTCYIAVVVGMVSIFFGHPIDTVGVSVMALGGPVALAIVFFNQPRFLVPPARRSDPGLLAERTARRGTGPSERSTP